MLQTCLHFATTFQLYMCTSSSLDVATAACSFFAWPCSFRLSHEKSFSPPHFSHFAFSSNFNFCSLIRMCFSLSPSIFHLIFLFVFSLLCLFYLFFLIIFLISFPNYFQATPHVSSHILSPLYPLHWSRDSSVV
jgi:hypothetical protein